MNSHRPEFIADTMLRGLGKWLRFLGFFSAMPDNYEEGQKLLNRNPTHIFLTSSLNHFHQIGESLAYLIKKNNIAEQLQEIDNRFHIFQRVKLFSICSLCNIQIQSITKEDLKERIPDAVKNSYEEFWSCPSCQRIYWQGGHTLRLMDKMRRMGIPIL
jgi:uncharacterized protein with PIN domain